jgi:hypothetical protein
MKQDSKRVTVAEIIEIADNIEVTSNMLLVATLEIAVLDSRG